MKFYVLIPLSRSVCVKVKERDYRIMRSELTPDYSRHFGTENEYYLDLTSKIYEVSGRRDTKYGDGHCTWYYSALNPCDVIKKFRRKK